MIPVSSYGILVLLKPFHSSLFSILRLKSAITQRYSGLNRWKKNRLTRLETDAHDVTTEEQLGIDLPKQRGVPFCSREDLFTSSVALYLWLPQIFFCVMGITCTTHYFPQSLQEPSPLSSKLYKPFPKKKRCTRGAVIMQLTGEGLASSNPPRYMNELISSVRYHYQYQCSFAAQDDSELIYGEKQNTHHSHI